MTDFGELITAMITPFNENLKINWQSVDKISDHLIKTGTDSILVSGTTGESPTLRDEEKIDLVKFLKKKFKDKIKIISGTGSYDTAHSCELSKKAEQAGADGILAVAPYYNKPSQKGLFMHFKMISESIKIPLIIYNVPSRTVSNISSSTCVNLAQLSNISAVKEASSDFKQIGEILRDADKDFKIYSGNDGDTFTIVAMGGYGVISVASHIIGEEIKKMISYIKNNNIYKAAEIHKNYLDIFYGIFMTSSPIPIKKAMDLIGLEAGPLRLPLCEMEKSEETIFKTLLAKHGII